MKTLQIREYSVLVDDEDFDKLAKNQWTPDPRKGQLVYFVRGVRGELKNERKKKYLHREILNFPNGPIDHIDQNTCNNTKENLRICSRSENNRNSKKRPAGKTGYVGVEFRKNRFRAYFSLGNKKVIVGNFSTAEEASLARKSALEKIDPLAKQQ